MLKTHKNSNLFFKNTIIILTISFCVCVLIFLANTIYLSQKIIKTQALDNAKDTINIIQKARSIYNQEVVQNVMDLEQVTVTHDYHQIIGNIPLPVTYLKELAQSVSNDKSDNRMKIKIYSDYPFPWRKNEEENRDQFEEKALQFLKQKPNESFYEFNTLEGETVLRYAVAEVMKPACIDCHNRYAGTPKTDWKVGEVRGILTLTQSLQNTKNQVTQNLKETFILLASLSAFGIMGLSLSIRGIYQYSRRLKNQLEVRQEAIRQAFTEIHNGPLQILALLLRELHQGQKGLPHFIDSLKILDQEIREIGDNLTQTTALKKQSLSSPTIRLGDGSILELDRPINELFFEIFTKTLKRNFPHFKTIRVKIRNFDPISDSSLDLALKKDLCYCLEEALCNVGKHAKGATKIIATGKLESGCYTLKVQDNGCGLNAPKLNKGTQNFQSLAKRIDGKVSRENLASGGVVWQLSWYCSQQLAIY